MPGVIVLEDGELGITLIACDKYPQPNGQIYLDNSNDLDNMRRRGRQIATILGVGFVDTTSAKTHG